MLFLVGFVRDLELDTLPRHRSGARGLFLCFHFILNRLNR